MSPALDLDGWTLLDCGLPAELLAVARTTCFATGVAGTRCLLDETIVRDIAVEVRTRLIAAGIVGSGTVAIQAIAFDKTAETNWKVAWHQDLMFPFARPVSTPGFSLAVVKEGVDYARPPVEVLENLLAVRLHLDDCPTDNGPLRVAPGSHREGVIPSEQVAARVQFHGEVPCLCRAGEAVLMKPLTLHASSLAVRPEHRRVLHLVYHAGVLDGEEWHRQV